MGSLSYSKAKGRSWEVMVCSWLRSKGIPAERRRQTGCEDCGDVGAWCGVVVEAKACKTYTPAAWTDELAVEVANADRRFGPYHVGLVIAKRHGKPAVEDAYAILPTEVAVAALQALLRERARQPSDALTQTVG